MRRGKIKDVAKELVLGWHTVKELETTYLLKQQARVGTPGPAVVGIDPISIAERHTYRVVVSDSSWLPAVQRGRP